MKLLSHIFVKDLRRLGWPLAAWLALVAGRVAATAVTSELAFANEAVEFVIGNVSMLLTIVDTLMLVLLVSWLVHEEPLVGAEAFWLTRPIPPNTLMTEKLAFAAASLVAAPAISQAAAVAIITRAPADAARVMPSFVFSQVLWVGALIALATVTPTVMRFLLTLAGSAVAAVFTFSAMATVLVLSTDLDSQPEPMTVDATSQIVAGWLFLGVAVAVIASQYHTRRLRRAIFIAVAGVVLTLVVADAWPWRFARAAEPDPGVWARDERQVALMLDDEPPYVSDAFGIGRRSAPSKRIALALRLTGLPPDFQIETVGVRGRLEFSDGRVLQARTGGMEMVQRPDVQRRPDHLQAIQGALGSTRLLGGSDFYAAYDQWPNVLTVTDAEYEQYGRTPGRFTGEVTVSLRRWRIAGSLPLVEGAMLRGPSLRIEIRRLAKRPDGCMILLRQGSIGWPQDIYGWRTLQWVVRNPQRDEAVFGDTQPLFSDGLNVGNWSFSSHIWQPAAAFIDQIARFPTRGARAPQIDRAWLDTADLVVIESAYAGRVSRSVTIDGFRMRP